MQSHLEILTAETGARRLVLTVDGRIEAPNFWPGDGALLVNGGGRLFRVPLDAPALIPIDTGPATRCNNDHGFSPDGAWIYLTSHHEERGAQIYRMPVTGGPLETISPEPPSWWHGISADGNQITYPAARGDRARVDICTLDLTTGREQRLTRDAGHNDGPDFAPDGRIFWNSDRGGHAQIWVMDADGQNPRQLFADDRVNWFPHPSPCGQHLCWLSYPPGTTGHPADLRVRLMLAAPDGTQARIAAEVTGGQGTMNVPNWSSDGRDLAFVHYTT